MFRPRTFQHLFLMGPPGSGKTTVGRILGNLFRRKVIDIDNDVLEPAWGAKVSDVVERHTRAEFLDLEAKTFMQALPTFPPHCIVSLTGSNPLHTSSFNVARIHNMCVLLDATAEVVESRDIDRGRIAGLDGGLAALFQERRADYEAGCDLMVPISPGQSPFQVAARVADVVLKEDARGM